MSTSLELREVRAGFGAHTVLHDLSYTAEAGQVTAVLGLNGAGKSVSLKVAGGFVPAWSGAVLLGGDDVTRVSPEGRVGRGVAHVPQGRQLFHELSVEENLRLGAYRLRRRQPERYAVRRDELFARFPILAERRTQPAGTLSGGERAMLAVARALMSEPALLLVDEPSAGLAPLVAEELFGLLRAIRDDGVTILLVEQNVRLALGIADHVHLMQRGRIAYSGVAGDLDVDAISGYLGIGRLLGTATARANGARKPRKKAAKA